jgi:DNA repair protein RecN (Recombination protein N)
MKNAQIEIVVEGAAGDEVEFRLAANPGAAPLRLAKVASGGELARTMLALRLVITSSPPTLVFDEVDAGIGGEAAHSVGSSLGQLGADHQVLVVTHLAQVAAYAHSQVAVVKSTDGSSTTTTVVELSDDERVTELSRMLSGSPDSDVANDHAIELLASAAPNRK